MLILMSSYNLSAIVTLEHISAHPFTLSRTTNRMVLYASASQMIGQIRYGVDHFFAPQQHHQKQMTLSFSVIWLSVKKPSYTGYIYDETSIQRCSILIRHPNPVKFRADVHWHRHCSHEPITLVLENPRPSIAHISANGISRHSRSRQ